ncbi:BMC_2a_G0001070.mRNA.1.CDS.1 [Saccharomyces cerevisiae]|nr:BMC_2a_G0001070.mRNA.1.CDS.1 [Saccharomyces cerevisiae]CAI4242215.1 BMB_G0001070.mRNA.1.CDS.1 [Saccharomyces cerevisiae]CAI7036301.1 BMC_2a_G0001070.mRNA.1.CDS.1 [Saccharomyces cerevisiae]CAI7036680.1 BMB_G0001070.mRNA.1.CDS.1 [Saccharomyces cerevisiae]
MSHSEKFKGTAPTLVSFNPKTFVDRDVEVEMETCGTCGSNFHVTPVIRVQFPKTKFLAKKYFNASDLIVVCLSSLMEVYFDKVVNVIRIGGSIVPIAAPDASE